jgi:hypothetical protein
MKWPQDYILTAVLTKWTTAARWEPFGSGKAVVPADRVQANYGYQWFSAFWARFLKVRQEWERLPSQKPLSLRLEGCFHEQRN